MERMKRSLAVMERDEQNGMLSPSVANLVLKAASPPSQTQYGGWHKIQDIGFLYEDSARIVSKSNNL